MSDLIDRQELKEFWCSGCNCTDCETCVDMKYIDTVKSVKLEQAERHGKWIKVKYNTKISDKNRYLREQYDPTTDLLTHRYTCSACEQDSFMPDAVKDKFCKHCGAEMDK